MQKEIWKDIPDYEGLYQVSNLGRVRSLDRVIKGKSGCKRLKREKILKNSSNSKGYLFVCLCKDSNLKRYLVHRLVCLAFIGKSDKTVDHLDENKQNNCLTNLEYVSMKENINRYWNKTRNHQKKHERRSSPVLDTFTNKSYISIRSASRDVGVSPQTIINKIKRKERFAYLK